MMRSLDYFDCRLLLDGMMLMMSLYSLLSYCQQRKSIYWQYSLYILCLFATFRLDDLSHEQGFFKPGANYWMALTETLAFAFYIQFAIHLMDIRRREPFSYRVLKLLLGCMLIGTVIDTVLWLAGASDGVRSDFYVVNRSASAIGSCLVFYRILQLRQLVVTYFIVGSSVFIGSCVLSLLFNYLPELLPQQESNPLSYPRVYMQVGAVLEILFFTLGLSLQNHQTERDKISFQSQLIDQLRENEAKQARLNAVRDEIARDLHDEMGSQLSSISIMSQVTAQLLPPGDRARHRMVAIGETARQTMDSMREIVWSLNSDSESIQNVGLRIRETAYALFDGTGTKLEVSMNSLEKPELEQLIILSNKQRRDLFLIVKECLTNIVRHTNAQNVRLAFAQHSDSLTLTITDDGVGFNPIKTSSGLGLRNIRQRVSQLGAQLIIDSEPGKGTSVRLCYLAPVGEELANGTGKDAQLLSVRA